MGADGFQDPSLIDSLNGVPQAGWNMRCQPYWGEYSVVLMLVAFWLNPSRLWWT